MEFYLNAIDWLESFCFIFLCHAKSVIVVIKIIIVSGVVKEFVWRKPPLIMKGQFIPSTSYSIFVDP